VTEFSDHSSGSFESGPWRGRCRGRRQPVVSPTAVRSGVSRQPGRSRCSVRTPTRRRSSAIRTGTVVARAWPLDRTGSPPKRSLRHQAWSRADVNHARLRPVPATRLGGPLHFARRSVLAGRPTPTERPSAGRCRPDREIPAVLDGRDPEPINRLTRGSNRSDNVPASNSWPSPCRMASDHLPVRSGLHRIQEKQYSRPMRSRSAVPTTCSFGALGVGHHRSHERKLMTHVWPTGLPMVLGWIEWPQALTAGNDPLSPPIGCVACSV
jgi:hypothetical protein